MRLLPTIAFADCPPLDLICVPGGAGMNPLLNDEETLDFVRRQASGARYVTSVCTGSLVLGAAGLLRGKRATTHWMSLPMLSAFGCEPVAERVVVDRGTITGGGVTAGIDFALTIAGELFGRGDGPTDPARHRIRSPAAIRCRLARAGGRVPGCGDAQGLGRAAGRARGRGRTGGGPAGLTLRERR